MQLMSIEVENKPAGVRMLEALDEVVDAHHISIEDAALVYRNSFGHLRLQRATDPMVLSNVTTEGALTSLISLVAGPHIELLEEMTWRDELALRRISALLRRNGGAVLVVGFESSMQALDDVLDTGLDEVEHFSISAQGLGTVRMPLAAAR